MPVVQQDFLTPDQAHEQLRIRVQAEDEKVCTYVHLHAKLIQQNQSTPFVTYFAGVAVPAWGYQQSRNH